ncbi:hypothetical protein CHS0354_008734 [Potamilus streckersoni]|uniref:Uncharacterized protein n=1 Tax=Potamilus streckersoni TaxID=2493646 RepID=A0AAE0WE59_9BIVA|nr:hypothetical protein CHS0354_008734 [Potamilus streckersoni]
MGKTAAPMTNGSTTSITSINNKPPKSSITTIYSTSTTQPTTSTSLTSTTNSTSTWTLATSRTKPGTAIANIAKGAISPSSMAVFPMAGRIGLGIRAVLVLAGVVLVIKKYLQVSKHEFNKRDVLVYKLFLPQPPEG